MKRHQLNFFDANARFHHVGIAVQSIEQSCPAVVPVDDPIQGVAVAFADLDGLTIEYVQPIKPGSPVDESLNKGVKLLHICIEVPDLDRALDAARQHGFHRISSPVPARAFEQRRIVWVYSNTYGLFELLENPTLADQGQG